MAQRPIPDTDSAFNDAHASLISDQLDIGYWKLDLKTEALTWGGATRRIHEVDDNYQPLLSEAINFYDTQEPGRIAISEALDHTSQTGEPYDVECRFITAKGNRRWVRAMGKALYNSAGEMTHLEGLFQDISHYKQMQETSFFIQKELNYMTYALDHHAIVSMADAKGTIIYVNDMFCDVSQYSHSELLDHNHNIVSSHQQDKKFWLTFWQTISNGNIFKGEICNRKKAESSTGSIPPWYPIRARTGKLIAIFPSQPTLPKTSVLPSTRRPWSRACSTVRKWKLWDKRLAA